MTLLDIVDGVKTLLEKHFPGETVHLNYAPKGFERPAFLVEGGPVTVDQMGGGYVGFDVGVKITWFTAVDPYHNSQVEALMRRLAQVLALFYPGYVPIGDRRPHVDALKGDYGMDFAWLDATLHFNEPFEVGETAPLMEEVELNLKEER